MNDNALLTVTTVALACIALVILTGPVIHRAFDVDVRQPVSCSATIYSDTHEEHVRITTCYVDS